MFVTKHREVSLVVVADITLWVTSDAVRIHLGSGPLADIILVHKNPCFPWNIAIMNFLV